MITKAIGDILKNDTDLTNLVATYRSEPAIIDIDPPPEDCPNPVVIIRGPISGGRGGTRDSKGGVADYDVACYIDNKYSFETLRNIGWRVWTLMERADFSLEGYESVGVTALPPRWAPGDEYPGLIVQISCQFIK